MPVLQQLIIPIMICKILAPRAIVCSYIFLIRNEIDKDIMTFEDTCGGCELLFYSPVTVFYTHHTDRFFNGMAATTTVWSI